MVTRSASTPASSKWTQTHLTRSLANSSRAASRKQTSKKKHAAAAPDVGASAKSQDQAADAGMAFWNPFAGIFDDGTSAPSSDGEDTYDTRNERRNPIGLVQRAFRSIEKRLDPDMDDLVDEYNRYNYSEDDGDLISEYSEESCTLDFDEQSQSVTTEERCAAEAKEREQRKIIARYKKFSSKRGSSPRANGESSTDQLTDKNDTSLVAAAAAAATSTVLAMTSSTTPKKEKMAVSEKELTKKKPPQADRKEKDSTKKSVLPSFKKAGGKKQEMKKQSNKESSALAASRAKKAEAEAKLAALLAEQGLKQKEREIKKEEKRQQAEIAEEEAKLLEAEARKAKAELMKEKIDGIKRNKEAVTETERMDYSTLHAPVASLKHSSLNRSQERDARDDDIVTDNRRNTSSYRTGDPTETRSNNRVSFKQEAEGSRGTDLTGSAKPTDAALHAREYDEEGDGHVAIEYAGFNNDPAASLLISQYSSVPKIRQDSEDVLVKVEASTVSYTDCVIRKGVWWGAKEMSMPATPGVDFVGKVCLMGSGVGEKHNLKTDDCVAALICSGGNSRYLKVNANQLVKVPKELAPNTAACIVETYLAAFQSLHLGQLESTRYAKNSLLGKNILVVGGMAMVGQAMIELAFLAGALSVYVSCRPKHNDFVRSLGAIPLPLNIDDWLPIIEGSLDLVVDVNCSDQSNLTSRALNSGGRLVRIQPKSRTIEHESLLSTYDVYESWDHNTNLSKQDLAHLFQMVKMGVIYPPIAELIPLNKVPHVHRLYESKRVQGYFVCEPWLRTKLKAAN